MFRSVAWFRALASVLLLGFLTAGCDLFDRTKANEETEAHYLDGVTAKKLLDYDGAIAHFQNALKVNPNSGAAHRELGLLYDAQKSDFVTALYHYHRYRELRQHETNPVVDGRIFHCKVMLAREYASYLDRQQNQSELEDLRRKYAEKVSQVELLQHQLAGLVSATNTVAQPSPPAGAAGTNSPPAARTPGEFAGRPNGGAAATNKPPVSPANYTAKPARTHTVKSGDTLARIAREHGVTLEALRAANPRINPSRLKVGDQVILPPK